MRSEGYTEADWKLLRKKIPGWQEAHMAKLIREYINILIEDANPSRRFWKLDARIREDQKSVGVQIDMRRSRMIENIVSLISDGVIQFEDIEDFSEGLKERVRFYFRF